MDIAIQNKLTVSKGNLFSTRGLSFGATIAATNPTVAAGAASIGTTQEALVMQDVSAPGWSYFLNADATNYVELGTFVSAVFTPFAKLLPGEAIVIRLGTTAPYARANTAAVVLFYEIHSA